MKERANSGIRRRLEFVSDLSSSGLMRLFSPPPSLNGVFFSGAAGMSGELRQDSTKHERAVVSEPAGIRLRPSGPPRSGPSRIRRTKANTQEVVFVFFFLLFFASVKLSLLPFF